jgi:hypothetical protein
MQDIETLSTKTRFGKNEDATYCRSAKREPYGNLRFPGVGFRFALVPYAEEQLQGAETPEEE